MTAETDELPFSKAPQLRAEYERMNRESLEKNVESLVRSKVSPALPTIFLPPAPSSLLAHASSPSPSRRET